MVNFTDKLKTAQPKTQKEKDYAVMQSLLKEHGIKFYEYPLAARANFREQRYAELFLGATKPMPTPAVVKEIQQQIEQLAKGSIDIPLETAIKTSPEFEQAASGTALAVVPVTTPDEIDKLIAKEGQFIPADDDHAGVAKAKDIENYKDTEDPKATFSLNITLNEKQLMGAEFAEKGQCFIFTGPAGCGKTTGCREIAKKLIQSNKLRKHDFKIRGTGTRWWGPSIAIVAYTNRASDNMRRALHKDPILEETLAGNITTVHNLLEYEPVFFMREDGSQGMKFEPKRTAQNKLRITHLIIEEASQIGALDLWPKLFAALPSGCQVIFVGDINQLPPIFSPSILNYALVSLPVVELTEVYRQALDSPILSNAHRCLRGEKLVSDPVHFRVIQKAIAPGQKIPSEGTVVNLMVNSLKKWNEQPQYNAAGEQIDGEVQYNPDTDIILCPFGKENKNTGSQANTTMINNHIAQFLGAKRNALVYEVIAGIRKLYLAIGDRVMIDKQDGVIMKIAHNAQYMGKMPQPASTELTRFGVRILGAATIAEDEDFELAIEGYENLDVSKIADENEEPRRNASHMVDVLLDSGRTVTLSAAGDFSESFFSLGYALTVHKAQGCEWRKVFILIHKNHATMLNRELMYTAITRAREYCVIVDLCNQLDKAISVQRIKGNTVAEKIEWFNSEVSLKEPVLIVP